VIDICTLKIPLGQFPISWFACHSAETSKRLFKILQFAMTLLVHTLFCLPYLKILTLQFLPTHFFLTLFAAIEEMYRIHLRSTTLLLIVNPSNFIRIIMTAFGTGLNRTVFQKECWLHCFWWPVVSSYSFSPPISPQTLRFEAV
jgi:hypothetical protein